MRYQIIKDGYTAEIETCGAELKSFRSVRSSVEYLWQADPSYWGGSAPWLFPIVCDLRDERVILDGKVRHIPRHGFVSSMNFNVLEKTEDLLKLGVTDTPETWQCFPYTFSLEIVYQIVKGALSIQLCVHTTGDRRMPFFLGGHMGFNCPLFSGDSFEDYHIAFSKNEVLNLPTIDPDTRLVHPQRVNLHFSGQLLKLSHALFDRDALIFDRLNSRSVRMINAQGKGVSVDFPDFEMLALWTMPRKSAPYVCIEPWNGAGTYVDEDDIFEHKRGVQYALPNQNRSYGIVIRALE